MHEEKHNVIPGPVDQPTDNEAGRLAANAFQKR